MEKFWLDLYGSEKDKYLENGKKKKPPFGLIREREFFEWSRYCMLLKNNFAARSSFIPKQYKFLPNLACIVIQMLSLCN